MTSNSIPKVIHYCWFGGNDFPNSAKKCIESWVKFFPEYEIKEWNESNFDIKCCDYVKEAYAAKKWAFVSDYARFWILFHEGGLYFDTDVEVIKDMHEIVTNGAFMGCEAMHKCAPGLGIGASPGLGLYKELIDYYNNIHFFRESGDVLTVVDYTSNILLQHGWKGNGKIEEIENVYIYPPEYFCPLDYTTGKLNITDNTYSIHWYTASWQSKYSRLKTRIQRLLGEKITQNIIWLKQIIKGKK